LPFGRKSFQVVLPCSAFAKIHVGHERSLTLASQAAALATIFEQPLSLALLRFQRCGLVGVGAHALHHLDKFSRRVARACDEIQAMAVDAVEQKTLLVVRSGHAHQPLSIRKLRGEVFGAVDFQIGGGGLGGGDGDLAGIFQIVTGRSDVERVLAGIEATAGKVVSSAGIADDGDGDGGVYALGADQNSFQRTFFSGADDAGESLAL